jgi:hypothetical protein
MCGVDVGRMVLIAMGYIMIKVETTAKSSTAAPTPFNHSARFNNFTDSCLYSGYLSSSPYSLAAILLVSWKARFIVLAEVPQTTNQRV